MAISMVTGVVSYPVHSFASDPAFRNTRIDACGLYAALWPTTIFRTGTKGTEQEYDVFDRAKRTLARWGRLSLLLLMTGCSSAHYLLNKPLEQPVLASDRYSLSNLKPVRVRDDILLILSFSGGGFRSAALDYGVLEVLRDTRFSVNGESRSLLDEVDMITAVSGGTLAASYLALYGQEAVDRFRDDVLRNNFQAKLFAKALSPEGIIALTSRHFGRSDLLEQLLDQEIFHNATFGDLHKRGLRPLLLIRATDMTRGTAFDFTQENFDRLCSDLKKFTLARAVAASMSVPVVFSPITLKNYSSECRPEIRSAQQSRVAETRDYVHLLDGGLVDNLGVRAPIDYAERAGSFIDANRANGIRDIRHVVVLLVNSEVGSPSPEDFLSATPNITRSLQAWIDIPISRYTNESRGAVQRAVAGWRHEVEQSSNSGTVIRPDAKFYVVEVGLEKESGLLDRLPVLQQLNAVSTSLKLTDSEMELLREHARNALLHSTEFLRLLKELNGSIAPHHDSATRPKN